MSTRNKGNNKMLSRKQIRKIESLELTEKELEKSKEYFLTHNKDWLQLSNYADFLRKETGTYHGLCCHCAGLSTKKVTYRNGLVERFCNKHFTENIKAR